MSELYDELTDELQDFIRAQQMFFIATSPLAGDGLINSSPKGLDTLRILDRRTLAYLDLTGSGAETIAHLRENGRFVMLFCSFTNKPLILRLHGRGQAIESNNPEFNDLIDLFPAQRGTRAVIKLGVERIADSCGWGVPRYEFQGQRDTYPKYADGRSDDQLRASQQAGNMRSLDGLPALTEPTAYAVSATGESK
jgi:hypothetical protein